MRPQAPSVSICRFPQAHQVTRTGRARQLYDLGTELSDARAEGNRNADSIRVEMLQSETRLRSLLVASQREGKKW